MVEFGMRLRILRKNSGLTQGQLAERLNLTKSVISAYENDIRLPSYDVLITLSRIFKVSTDYLLGQSRDEEDRMQSEMISVDLTGLNEDEILAVKNLVRAMKNRIQ